MTSHTKGDGLPGPDDASAPWGLERATPRNEQMAGNKVECNACPVLCQISDGRVGACDRYANRSGVLVRLDPVVLLHQGTTPEPDTEALTPRHDLKVDAQDQTASASRGVFVTGIGSSTTYPDYKPAPFIVASQSRGVDMVTVVTEGIFSYCSLKVKIDTDRYLGPEQASVLCKGEVVGHVTTAEYGSQMLSFGTVPTPAIVAPIEFTMRLSDYQALGGHMGYVRSLDDTLRYGAWHNDGAPTQLRWVSPPASDSPWPLDTPPMLG